MAYRVKPIPSKICLHPRSFINQKDQMKRSISCVSHVVLDTFCVQSVLKVYAALLSKKKKKGEREDRERESKRGQQDILSLWLLAADRDFSMSCCSHSGQLSAKAYDWDNLPAGSIRLQYLSRKAYFICEVSFFSAFLFLTVQVKHSCWHRNKGNVCLDNKRQS